MWQAERRLRLRGKPVAVAGVLALLAAVLHAQTGYCSPPHPHIVVLIADDLGMNDLGFLNGGKTQTPYIDALVKESTFLSGQLMWKLCSPSRASFLSGRLPWGVGFYDMSNDGAHCINESTRLMPDVLKDFGYSTHAVGKYDVGRVLEKCTATERGFDTFLGYYTACTSDYWYHGAPGGNSTADDCGGVDYTQASTSGGIQGAPMSGPDSLNGTYDQDVFTNRAMEIISEHDPDQPLFMYIAHHVVHDTCQARRTSGATVLQAPCADVGRYATTSQDGWKVQAAMTTQLDYGVGNVTELLKSKGMWNDTVFLMLSDNGGPLDHSSNAPFTDGKASWFEGGLRVPAIVHSPLLGPAMAGATWSGMVHASDWYTTFVEGVIGMQMPNNTGPRPPDGFNVWDAIRANATSPRTEVIHGVNGSDVIPPLTKEECPSCGSFAARFGDWKVIFGVKDGKGPQAWPEPTSKPIPFGQSGGVVEAGTDHCRAPLLPVSAKSIKSDSGIWLFNLESDPYESKNLADDPQYSDLIEGFRQKIAAAARTGPRPAFITPPNASEIICDNERKYGYLEPVDWKP